MQLKISVGVDKPNYVKKKIWAMFLGFRAMVMNPSSTGVPILTIQDTAQHSGKGIGPGVERPGL